MTASGEAASGTVTIGGHAWAEQAGANAVIRYYSPYGGNEEGVLCMTITLGPNESVTDFYDGKMVQLDTGLYIEIVGTVEGCIFAEA
jgi:hypothetical protein